MFSDAKDLGEIPVASPLTATTNTDGVGHNRQISANISIYNYLRNGATAVDYTHCCAIDRCCGIAYTKNLDSLYVPHFALPCLSAPPPATSMLLSDVYFAHYHHHHLGDALFCGSLLLLLLRLTPPLTDAIHSF